MDQPAIAPLRPLPRAVLFDLDDTLCDYAAARNLRLRIAFSRDLATSGDDVQAVERNLDQMVADSLAMQLHGADHFPELFHRHGIADTGIARRAMTWFQENHYHGLALFPDARSTIETLRRLDLPIGLVTNGPTEIQRGKVALLGIEDLVDFVVISEEFGAWKPDPTIFREALRLAAVEPGDAVFIGDSPDHDIAGAKASQIRSIWINRTGSAWHPANPPPTAEIRSLSDLIPLMW